MAQNHLSSLQTSATNSKEFPVVVKMEPSSQSSQPPKAWLVAYAFGVASEVWMYRQASLMNRLELTVVANRHENPQRFPAKGFDIRLVEGRRRPPPWQPFHDLALSWQGRLNRKVPAFAKSRAETEWWLSQINNNRPDVVLAQYGPTALELYPLLQSVNIPLIAHFHGFDLSRQLRNKRYCRMLRDSAGQLAAYVVVAEYMREELIAFDVPAETIFKIPCGTPPAPTVRKNEPDPSRCRFLAVGRFVDKKRPDLTIRAFAQMAAKDSTSSLTMIGDGPLYQECKKLASALGVQDRIEFLGSQPQDRVLSELANASVFVQHSATAQDGDKEGWPVSIAEAAAHGLPVVATRHASIPEQIPHGEAGLLCDEGDWETMSKHLLELAADPDTRLKMGQAARRQMEMMAVENQVKQLENVLLDVAARSLSTRGR